VARSNSLLITIFGGSGFIGRHLVQKLASQGHRLRIGVRRPDLAVHLQPLGGVGQIKPVQANVRYPKSLAAACHGADVVINLTGVLSQTRTQSFEAVHEFGATAIAKAAKAGGAGKLIHMSAIGADKDAASAYGKSKYAGEQGVAKAFPGVVILRPSVVFGPEDEFFNKFAELTRFSMVLPLIGGGKTKFQPVYVGDVAEAVAKIVATNSFDGKIFELGGSQVFTFKQLLDFILTTTERKRLLVPVPWFVAKPLGSILSLLPGPLLTRDQVVMLQSDNVVSEAAAMQKRTLEGLGIVPETIATRVPPYLFRYKKFGQFTETGSSSI
jgi:NADH dehydrogenase